MNIEELFTAEAHNNGAEMCVKDQNGKDTAMFLTLAGKDSEIWRKAEAESRTLIMNAAVNGKDVPDTVNDILATATIGWRGFKSKGKSLKFSKKAILQLYDQAPYVADQANYFIGKRANFIKG